MPPDVARRMLETYPRVFNVDPGPGILQPATLAVLVLDHYDAPPDFRIRLCAESIDGETTEATAIFHADVASYARHRDTAPEFALTFAASRLPRRAAEAAGR